MALTARLPLLAFLLVLCECVCWVGRKAKKCMYQAELGKLLYTALRRQDKHAERNMWPVLEFGGFGFFGFTFFFARGYL